MENQKEEVVIYVPNRLPYRSVSVNAKERADEMAMEKQLSSEFDKLLRPDWRDFVTFDWSGSFFQIKDKRERLGKSVLQKQRNSKWTINEKSIEKVRLFIDVENSRRLHELAVFNKKEALSNAMKPILKHFISHPRWERVEDFTVNSLKLCFGKLYQDGMYIKIQWNAEEKKWVYGDVVFSSSAISTIQAAQNFIQKHDEDNFLMRDLAHKVVEKMNFSIRL